MDGHSTRKLFLQRRCSLVVVILRQSPEKELSHRLHHFIERNSSVGFKKESERSFKAWVHKRVLVTMEAISEGILFFGVLAGMVCLCVFLGSKLVALEAEFEQDAKKKRPAEKVA